MWGGSPSRPLSATSNGAFSDGEPLPTVAGPMVGLGAGGRGSRAKPQSDAAGHGPVYGWEWSALCRRTGLLVCAGDDLDETELEGLERQDTELQSHPA